jgi:hypothetical protein
LPDGYIHNGNQPVQWIPNGKKPSTFRFSAADGGVKLSSQLSRNGYNAEAFYCDACHVVVAKTERYIPVYRTE